MNKPKFAYNSCVYDCEIFPKFKTVVVDILGVDEEEVEISSNLFRDLGADSLDLVEILINTEKKFGVSIPEDEFENWSDKDATIENSINIIKKYMKKGEE